MDAFGVKDGSSAEFISSFQERVVKKGVPAKLVADNAPLYRSRSIAKYLLELRILLFQCERKKQYQNKVEGRWQVAKRYTNRVLDRTKAPNTMWLYALMLVIFCLNHMVDPVLATGNQTPAGYASNTVTYISPLLPFAFCQLVYYLIDPSDRSIPEDSEEKRDRWVGISENIGGHMTLSSSSSKTVKANKLNVLSYVQLKTKFQTFVPIKKPK